MIEEDLFLLDLSRPLFTLLPHTLGVAREFSRAAFILWEQNR